MCQLISGRDTATNKKASAHDCVEALFFKQESSLDGELQSDPIDFILWACFTIFNNSDIERIRCRINNTKSRYFSSITIICYNHNS